ncbi:MAG: hypothetical protein HRU09_02975 [Oligoflexales bacterium]|nr:hypothetical protein [Oligoflexales bacterium]
MDQIWIANAHLKVSLSSKLGGRVTGIFPLAGPLENQNILWWQAQNEVKTGQWLHGGIPLLFPFAGWVWDDEHNMGSYRIGGERFVMPIHGFSYSYQWNVLSASESKICLGLEETDESLGMFPFKFILKQEWELRDQELHCHIEVKNRGYLGQGETQKMPLSLGLHPYFSAATLPMEQVILESQARSFCPVSPEGKAEPEQIVMEPISWDLSQALHHNGILCNFPPGEARSSLASKHIKLSIDGVGSVPTSCMVTWSDRRGEFFCLEPWMGKPDALNANYGLQWLDRGESLIWSTCMRIA